MREWLELWMDRKTSTLTTGLSWIAIGAGFLSMAGALGALAARVRKLEKGKGDGADL